MEQNKLKTLKRYLELINVANAAFDRAAREENPSRRADYMCCGRVILTAVDWADFAQLSIEFEQEDAKCAA